MFEPAGLATEQAASWQQQPVVKQIRYWQKSSAGREVPLEGRSPADTVSTISTRGWRETDHLSGGRKEGGRSER